MSFSPPTSFYEDEMSRYPTYGISSIARSTSSQGSSSALSPQSTDFPLSPHYSHDNYNDDWSSHRYGSWANVNHGSSGFSSGAATWSDSGAFDYTYGAQGSSFASADAYSTPSTAIETKPSRSGSGSGSGTGAGGTFICLYPDCTSNGFKRKADLERHIKNCHLPLEKKESYYCDYPRCSRRNEPFHRRDHFRDHLREFHKEDIEKRGGSASAEFYESRNIKQDWWRCSRCLDKVTIKAHGYDCPKCKSQCNDKRQKLRTGSRRSQS